MADALIKAWHGVFDRGSKQAQERLKKVHGHKPEFQAFLKSRGIEGGERSAKQATTSLKKATDTKVAAQKIADMRFKKALQASSDRVREMGRRRREGGEGLGGSLETTKDVIAHIKQYGSIKAGRLGEAMDRTQLIGKVAKDIEKKKAATKIVDRLKTISYGRGAGLNPAKDMKLNPSSPLKTDMSALSNKRHSMNYEEVQIDEVSKAEAEKVLGGAVKEKPKMPPGKQPAGYRYVRGLARRAMKGGVSAIHKSMEKTMAKEEVEQVDEARRMSAAEKLGRAFDSEQQRSALSRQRGLDLLKQKDTEKMQNKLASGNMTKLKKEETEESTMKYIEEKLTAADPASKWISDFVKSDNPKFAGKSKKERIQQALGAYYAKKRGTNEEVELDESHGAEKLGDMLESDADHETKMKRIKIAPTAHLKYLHKYNMGYSGGGDHPMIKHIKDELKNRKMKNEEVEQMDEGKDVDHAKTVANSLAATHPNFRVSSYNGDHGRAHVVHHKSDTRNFKNGEQLMGPNIQLQHNHKTNKVHMEMQGDYDNVPDRDEETHHPDKAHEAAHKMFKPAIDLIHKTDKKTTNEEVEQMDEGIILEGNLSIRALYNKYADHYTSSEGNSAKRADAVEKTITKVHGPEVMNHLKKAVKANLRNDMDQEENHFERARNAADKSGSDRVNATVGKNRSKFRKEEVVLEEPKDAADVGEYDYEGDMAKSQLRSIMANSKRMHDMLEDTTNLPEWVQSKITLAEDYVVTAANYMEGEMNEAVERVDELKKSTLQSYAKKASKEMKKAHDYHQMRYGGRDGSDSEYMKKTYPAAVAKYDRRDAGVAKAKQKIAKEEVEQMDEAIRGYIKSEPGNEDGTAVRRPADQAERNQLARNLIANRKYNLGKKIGKKSGSVRKNAAGMTPSQKISTALRSPEASKKLDPKEFPYMPKNAKITPFLSKEEAEGKVAVTPKEKSLAAHHGDPKKITYGDVIKARLKSAAAKKMGK